MSGYATCWSFFAHASNSESFQIPIVTDSSVPYGDVVIDGLRGASNLIHSKTVRIEDFSFDRKLDLPEMSKAFSDLNDQYCGVTRVTVNPKWMTRFLEKRLEAALNSGAVQVTLATS